MATKVQLEELADIIKSTPSFSGSRYIAKLIAERIIDSGWQPPQVELTDAQAVDIVERIIEGRPLPEAYGKPANPEGTAIYRKQLYDVNSLNPQPFVSDWYRIPEFDNYEIRTNGEIRNRFTKRPLDVTVDGGVKYVEMHDKDGFPHYVSVDHQVQQVFGGV